MSNKPEDPVEGDRSKPPAGGADDLANARGGGRITGQLEAQLNTVVQDPVIARFAQEAVEELGVKQFINDYEEPIYDKLLECDSYAETAKVNSDMMFIARSLPVINGIIHIASNRERLSRAMRWVEKNMEESEPDAISILSALTLIYVAVQGEIKRKDRIEEREAWRRILRRVRRFSSDMADQ